MLEASTLSNSLQGTISMTIYKLYIKTHNKTGLKYLGYTKRENVHKYSGSGVYWTRHLKEHGKDYTTEIIKECQTKDEIKEHGLYYSNLWNVVESTEWANIKPESGDGGDMSSSHAWRESIERRKASDGYTRTSESITKGLTTAKERGSLKRTPESIAKTVETKRANGSLKRSAESRAKQSATRKANGIKMTPEAIAKMLASRARNKSLKSGTPS